MKTQYPKLRTALCILCCLTVVMIPIQANAFLGLSFDLFSFGPFSIGIDLPFKGVAALLGVGLLVGAAISYFTGGSGHSYSASYPNAPPPTRHVKVSIEPDAHYTGYPLRIHLIEHKIIDDQNRISLSGKGFLEVDFETGKMIFRGTDFKGYMYFHYNRSLTVWDDQNNPVLVLTTMQEDEGERLLILQEKSDKGEQVVAILFGGAK